jgi:hypothetical protein
LILLNSITQVAKAYRCEPPLPQLSSLLRQENDIKPAEKKKKKKARPQWFILIILATQETKIRRIMV